MASSARIDELRKKFDENPRRYFAPLANEYRKSGDLEQAIFICQEYLPQQPGHMSGHIVYGQALFELSRFDEARAVFETALSLDPENLIALRHLGDIARQADDLRGARAWYQRVLEADPRNEEIAQIMLTVLATPHGGQAAVRTGNTPLGTDAVAPEEPLQIERFEEKSELTIGPELSELAERQPEPEPIRRSREALPDDELLDLNDFSVGDIPLSSLGTMIESTPADAMNQPQPVFAADAPSLTPDESESVLSADDATFEVDHFAFAATPSTDDYDFRDARTEELAANITLGLSDEGGAPALSDPQDNVTMEGLESFSDSTPSQTFSTESSSALETESFFQAPPTPPIAFEVQAEAESEWTDGIDAPNVDAPTFSAGLDALVVDTPSFAEPAQPVEPESFPVDAGDEQLAVTAEYASPSDWDVPPAVPTPAKAEIAIPEEVVAEEVVVEEVAPEEAAPAEAFVTETMAELYLQQGHLEAALDIYERLVEQRPDDEQLRQRRRAISDSILAESSVKSAPPMAPEPIVDEAVAGPTIREFLSVLLRAQRGSGYSAVADAPPEMSTDFDEPIFVEPLSTEPVFDESSFGIPAYGESTYGVELSGTEIESYDSGFDIPVEPADEFAPEPEPWVATEPESVFPIAAEEVEFVAPAEAPVVETIEQMTPVASARPTPSSSETVTGSIDALFSGADASSSDSDAAATLAQAFAAESHEPAPLQGLPAHRAADELSLDHVFKSNPAPRSEAEGEGFSFDQFFADDMSEAPSKPGSDPSISANPGGGTDDIAQFNNWLNGLKKT